MPAELRQSYGAWIRANGLEAVLPALYTLVSAVPCCLLHAFMVDPALSMMLHVLAELSLSAAGTSGHPAEMLLS